jgi:hypothetical protein
MQTDLNASSGGRRRLQLRNSTLAVYNSRWTPPKQSGRGGGSRYRGHSKAVSMHECGPGPSKLPIRFISWLHGK